MSVIDSKDAANLALLERPELGITFTKLHCWRLTRFSRCVFLDADTLVLRNCDELFDREEFSAAPDAGWPDCFNSGVFVYRPSEDTYDVRGRGGKKACQFPSFFLLVGLIMLVLVRVCSSSAGPGEAHLLAGLV